jgi:hypothetical protein
MADEHIWVEFEGDEEALIGIDVYHAVIQVRAKNLLDELAKDGVTFLAKNVPNSPPYSKGYTLEHVDRTPVHGDYDSGFDATVGIKAGRSYHPVYVNRGTGVYGPFIKQPYTARNGQLMWFYASRIGARIGRESVKGQRAQHFLYTTFRELQVFALARMTTGAF